MSRALPSRAGRIAEDHPDLWAAYAALGEAAAKAGPLSARERRLVKLALSVGAQSEGAVHSHTRRALAEVLGESAPPPSPPMLVVRDSTGAPPRSE